MKNKKEYIESINWELLSRVLNSTASEDDQNEFSIWLNTNPDNYLLYQKLQKTGDININKMGSNHIDTELALKNVKQKIRKAVSLEKEPIKRKRKYFSVKNITKMAAAIALLLSIGYFIQNIEPLHDEQIVIKTTNIERLEIILPDQTRVYLNSNSVLTYPKMFINDSRKVKIEGEAFFDVHHNPAKPFIISALETEVKVLGTSFDLKAYNHKEDVEIMVASGKVSFSKQKQDQELILNKGDLGKYSKMTDKFSKAKNEDLNYLAWKTKNLDFNNTNLNNVIAVLQEVYMLELKIMTDDVIDCKLTARFVDQSLEEVLNSLQFIFNLRIEKKDKIYYIYGNKC